MKTYLISQLSKELGISARTIRYYEEKGLIKPNRTEKGTRVYYKKDYTRLRLILKGKKFGLTLDEIHELLSLFDQDRSGKKQLEKAIEYCEIKELEVENRIKELQELKEEIKSARIEFQKQLKKKNV